MPTNLSTGTRLGPYEILSPIGAGGMGEVWLGRDTRLDRSVAIKVLPSHLSSNPQFRERFEREARAVSALNHPNICTLHDVGHQDRVDYIVMELLEGETLAERLQKGPLPLEQVLRYGVQIAEGLDKAHRHGIVHRDLKPGNIMLTKSGAKLLDFGLAKSAGPLSMVSTATNLATEQKPLTQEGTILGTFQYMAPEQLEGQEADARTDIFAFGCVLYEMVTGRRAFQGKTRTSLIAAIVGGQPPPVRELQPLAPLAFEHVIAKCLEKDPDERWQSAHDVATELTWSGEVVEAGVRQQRTRKAPLLWIAFGTLLLLSVAVITALLMSRPQSMPRVVRASVVPPEGKRFSFGLNAAGALSLSPDGRFVTFVADEEDSLLYLRPLAEDAARPLPGTAGATYPFWSPDSRWIGFFAGGQLKKIAVSGGPALTICSAPDGRGGTWSRDGTILFEPHWRDPIHRVSAAGGASSAVTKLDPAASETTHRWPWMLPDGEHFLYLAGSHVVDSTSELNAVYAGSLRSSERKLILHARSNVAYVNGFLFFVRDRFLMAQRFDAGELELQGEPLRIAENVSYLPGFFRSTFAVSGDALVFYSGSTDRRSQLSWVGRDGKEMGTIGEPEDYRSCRLSPDGAKLAAEIGDPSDLWMIDLKRGVKSRFTVGNINEGSAAWSPDGKTVAYSDDREVVSAIYTKSIDSSQKETLVYKSAFFNLPSDWSPDGRFLSMNVIDSRKIDTPSGGDVWILPMSGERKPFPFAASEFRERHATFSPDGRWIAYLSNETGRDELYAARFPNGDGKRQISTAGARGRARWIEPRKELIFTSRSGAEMSATFEGDEFGVPKQLLPPDPRNVDGDVFPDGSRFLLIRQISGEKNDPVTLVTGWRALLPN